MGMATKRRAKRTTSSETKTSIQNTAILRPVLTGIVGFVGLCSFALQRWWYVLHLKVGSLIHD